MARNDEHPSMRVYVHFYSYNCYRRLPLLRRWRVWLLSTVSPLVHCNYQIGPWVYDLNASSYDIHKGLPDWMDPTVSVGVDVEESQALAFIQRFTERYYEQLPRWQWVKYVLGYFFPARFTNCSLFGGELTHGGERSPCRLYQRLSKAEQQAA